MILGVLHARMSSSRMPGKALAPILGEPMIIRQLDRIRRARSVDRVVVATSRDNSDNPLAAYLVQRGVTVFRGSAEDAVDRCAKACAGAEGVTHVARFFCDNPLIDPYAIDAAVNLALASGAAYVGSGEHGGVEVIAAPALAQAAAEPRDTRDRRDLRFFFGRRADRFARAEADDGAPRWTVDTPADFAFVRAAYEALYPANPGFGAQDVLNWLCAQPNAGVRPRGIARAAPSRTRGSDRGGSRERLEASAWETRPGSLPSALPGEGRGPYVGERDSAGELPRGPAMGPGFRRGERNGGGAILAYQAASPQTP